MSLLILEKSKLGPFVERLISQSEVVGPKRKENSCVFGTIQKPEELFLDYTTTILPPKKFFLPQEETILRFNLEDEPDIEPVVEVKERILFGVHPCDLWAIWEMDKVFSDKNEDTNYLERRRATTIIGWECLNPDESCFCTSVQTSVPMDEQFDLFFVDIGDEYAVKVGSEKGQRLIAGEEDFRPARNDTLAQIKSVQDEKAAKITASIQMDVNEIPLFLEGEYESPVWKLESERCYSCGSCVMVCPTCFCFDVFDQVSLDLGAGERIRRWDGCMLPNFALVASGENFRETAEERLRHRIYRKYQYLMVKYGKSFCVGCGRCWRSCLVEINPVDVLNKLIKTRQGEGV
ncbi:TPA: Ni/Fe hydrogenase subunit beta [Candidatus Poribacteria bacterium]|nr:Ni/Fe hydrogenase subunit beta [Candidatus Poribacteria bacterium]